MVFNPGNNLWKKCNCKAFSFLIKSMVLRREQRGQPSKSEAFQNPDSFNGQTVNFILKPPKIDYFGH